MPTANCPSKNALDGDSWRAFLAEIIKRDPQGLERTSCNRRPLADSDIRQLNRWTNEGVLPSIWSADGFLTRHGIHLDQFFIFAERRGSSGWARGQAPAWHQEDWDWEDERWTEQEPKRREKTVVSLERGSVEQTPSEPEVLAA